MEQQNYNSLDNFIRETEETCGVRFSWNLLPSSRIEANRTVIPMGCLLTPLSKSVMNLPYEPLKCLTYECEGIMNVYCPVNFHDHTWVCCFCSGRNMMPPHYHGMTELNKSAELVLPSVEYILKAPSRPSVFLFVVDTCVDQVEMTSLRDNLLTTLALLPQQSYVGLISFSRVVYVHELSCEKVSRSYVFKGSKSYSKSQIEGFLGIESVSRSSNMVAENKFIQRLDNCDANMGDLVTALSQDIWTVDQGKHPQRATGAALSVAISLAEVLYPNLGGRIMLFTGGPCTCGPGQVCSDNMKKPIRTHHDIMTDNCDYMNKAIKHYSALAERAVQNGQAMDILSCTPKETGVHEMSVCVDTTGGEIIFADSFESELFSQNLRALLQHDSNGDLQMGLNAAVKLKVSKDLVINGVIGHVKSHNQKDSTVSSTVIGSGSTNLWKVCALTPRTTLAFFFGNENKVSPQGNAFFQFVTNYQHPNGSRHLRVTTVARNWCGPNDSNLVPHYFDQYAGAVLMTRKGLWHASSDYSFQISRYFDRNLIQLCSQFGDFQPKCPQSYRFHPRFTMIPQFVFHLRRSQFSRTSNNSPDETTYNRHIFMNEDVHNSLIMIQPVLRSYSYLLNNGSLEFIVQNAPLDASSIKEDRVLLMDTFFSVLIYFGRATAFYYDQQLHKQQEYSYLAQLFDVPLEDAKKILIGRFPVSRLIQTRHDGSQERFLLNRVNPSRGNESDCVVLTDDVSLEGFIESVKINAVSNA